MKSMKRRRKTDNDFIFLLGLDIKYSPFYLYYTNLIINTMGVASSIK